MIRNRLAIMTVAVVMSLGMTGCSGCGQKNEVDNTSSQVETVILMSRKDK